MRVLYLLLLVPLGALASCPAGLQLSNVPISTTLPYCVKWESSSLGGCEVNCPGVCVEMPNADSKGPIQTTGSECKLGTGGDGDGGDTGGDDAPYDYPFKNQISPIGVGGAYQEGTTAALKKIDEDLRWFAIKNYAQGKEMAATFGSFSRDLMKVTDALTTQSNNAEESGKTQFAIWQTLSRSEDSLLRLTNCVTNPLNNNCGHLAGSGSSGSSGGGDSKIYNELSQFHVDMFGQNFAENSGGFSMMGQLRSLSYDVVSMKERVHEAASDIHNLYTYVMPDLRNNSIEMNRNIKSIADAIKSGGIGGGDGGSSGSGLGQAYWDNKFGEAFGRLDRDYFGGTQNIDRSTSSMAQNMAAMTSQLGLNGVNGHLIDIKEALKSGGASGGESCGDIDYSKMPGAAANPLQVAGSEYESGLCQEGDNCAFDLGNINKQYDDKKEELKDKYKTIKNEVAEIFKFDLSGSGSVPKCFEMYSLFGKSYSVCPSVGGYWEALAAIMMFVFYFLALMIVARR